MENVAELKGVWKIYKTGRIEYPALRGVDLEVRKGEFIAIVGPSGSGKTTLLNIIGLLDRPTKGRVILEGRDVTDLDEDERALVRRRKIGFVFQQFNLISRLTALENVEVPMIAAGIPKKEREKRAMELLALLGMDKFAMHRPTELSGGQQQRVAIARALALDPSIIIADEPTGNLDTKATHDVMRMLRKLNEELGKTVILVTHDLELLQYADRVARIRDGKIVEVVERK